jgi:predicted small secreted protein
MRKLSIIIVLIGCFSTAQCQTFKGTVYDQSTDSTLSFAVVYISGTSIGTYTDINGNFELNISKCGSKPITISLIGYYSVTLIEYNSNKTYKIYLSNKINELNEVVVKGKKGKWETYLRIFKREFLGVSENASECDLLNEKDLRFFNIYDTTLSAYSLKPLLIHNKALGYTITYYLDKFKYSFQKDDKRIFNETCFILGNYLFKDDLLTLSESERQTVEDRRKRAYLGSRMQFFRLLYIGNYNYKGRFNILLSDTTISTVFLIQPTIHSKLSVIKKDSLSGYLKYKGDLFITYKKMGTTMNIKKDSVYFEKDGFYDPFGVVFSGEMSDRRIGDLLPFEYLLK